MFKALRSVYKKGKEKVRDAVSSDPIDNQYYAMAEGEVNSGFIDDGLWAKALIIAKGDEQQRKAEYIKMRARILTEEAGYLKRREKLKKIVAEGVVESRTSLFCVPRYIFDSAIYFTQQEAQAKLEQAQKELEAGLPEKINK